MKQKFIFLNILIFLVSIFVQPIIESSNDTSHVYHSVNVITGDYCEAETDAAIDAVFPIKIQRVFTDQGWIFNIPLTDSEKDESSPHDFQYDEKGRLIFAKILDKSKTETYGSLELEYNDNSFTIKCSDGKELTYDLEPQNFSTRFTSSLFIKKVLSGNSAVISYEYANHPTQRRKLISKRIQPNGSFLSNEYYDENDVNDTRDPRIGRVKEQKASVGIDLTPITTHRFFYYSGYTEVFDAYNRKSIYRYNENSLLTAIENYDSNQQLYRTEKIHWQLDKGDLPPQISSRIIEDGQGAVLSCRSFSYDAKGRVIQETLWGNLTGISEAPILLRGSVPLVNGVESFSTYWKYSDDGLLLAQWSDQGALTRLHYCPKTGNLLAKFVCEGVAVKIRTFFQYNAAGLLTKMIVDDGNAEEESDLHGVTERHITTYELCQTGTARGKPQSINEFYYSIASGEEHLLKRLINTYNHFGLLAKQQTLGPDGTCITTQNYEYDKLGRAIESSDSAGNATYTSYDSNGNAADLLILVPDKGYQQKKFSYDFANRLVASEETSAEGRTLVYRNQYDFVGNKTKSIDPWGNETTTEFDDFNRPIKIIHPEVLENDEPVQPTIMYEYDTFDRVIKNTDARGYQTETRYNARGKPMGVFYPDGTYETFEYNLNGTLSKSRNKSGLTSVFSYDIFGNTVQIAIYDANGNLQSTSSDCYSAFHLLSSTDAKGTISSYTYDSAGRKKMILVQDAESIRKTEFSYDTKGRPYAQKVWYGNGSDDSFTQYYNYDNEGKLTEIKTEDIWKNKIKKEISANSDPENTFTTYNDTFINARGQNVLQKVSTDGTGNQTIYTFDALGRCEHCLKKDGMGNVVSKQELFYDAVGNKTRSLVYNSQHDHELTLLRIDAWSYGPCNRLEKFVEGFGSALQRETYYGYDTCGRIKSMTKPDGIVIYHVYNAVGELSEYYSSDSSFHYKYEYDALHNIIKTEDLVNSMCTHRTYNALGKVTKETLGNGKTLAYDYDLFGRKTKIQLPDDSFIDYLYKGMLLRNVKRFSNENHLLYKHQYKTYDEHGRPTSMKMIGNAGRLSYDYDVYHRVTSIESPHWSEKIPDGKYTEEGNILEIITTDPHKTCNSSYCYDASNQLIQETGTNKETYTYDAQKNCLSHNEHSYQYDSLNQLLNDCEDSFEYDLNGNRIAWNTQGKSIHYRYDALNRLIAVEKEREELYTYTYDPFHRRIGKISYQWDGQTSQWERCNYQGYLYDGDCEIGSFHEDGKIFELRVLGIGLGAEIGAAVSIELEGKLYAPIHDHRGSVTCLVNAEDGLPETFIRYSTFGKETVVQNDFSIMDAEECSLPWRFSSKRVDPETGFLYYGKRYYSPEVARWVTRDPLGDIDCLNPYVFLKNNPLGHFDLHGLFSLSALWQSVFSTGKAGYDSFCYYLNVVKGIIQNDLSYFNFVKADFESIAKQTVGKNFMLLGGYFDSPEGYGSFGHNEINDKVRITLINGILNTREDLSSTLHLLTNTHGGTKIHYVFHSTNGWTMDMVNCFLVKFGYKSSQARLMALTWKNLIAEMGGPGSGGTIVHYAHSIGATDTYNAKNLLTPEEQKMIHVITLGSPTMISSGNFANVVNYVSRRDLVCVLDPIGYLNGLLKKDNNVIFLGTYLGGFPIIEHTLSSPSYAQILTSLGEQFLALYGS